MDISSVHRADWERRRKIRLAQVRDQSKVLAKRIRDRVHGASEVQLEQRETIRNKTEHKFKSLALNKLKSDFNYLIQDVGNGYSTASVQHDPSIVLAEKRLIDRCKAISRGAEAEKRQQRIQEEQQMDKEMRDRKTHFNKTVEKIRSTLITSVKNVDSDNKCNNKEQNECFLIPSHVTLNESNILNWNCNKKSSKPWSVVINSKEQTAKPKKSATCNDDNKENVENGSKFSKLETDVKSYESLVIELNKLSAEEQNIRNKLFPYNLKEVSVKNHVPSEYQQKNHKNPGKKHISNERTELKNDTKKQTTEIRLDESTTSTSICISSSKSSSTIYDQPPKKTIHFEKKVCEKKIKQPSTKLNYKEKFAAERPLQNINNMLQRIKNKKQLLVKEITNDTRVKAGGDVKKLKKVSSIPKISPVPKRCNVGNELREEIPVNYAKLPDSFYTAQLDTLKEHISKEKFKFVDSKCNTSINEDLMTYINTLLKMTPSDVNNLSTSSCSSINLEESDIQHAEKGTQYYYKLLICISKCLNADISDISHVTTFDSPKNINLLNRLQQLTNYYSEKTNEIKNICDGTPQILNDKLNVENTETNVNVIKENKCIDLTSESSVDEEYTLGNLNTLLQKKGIIDSNKEWPMFKNIDDDDDRSLTDQLLDIYPCSSYDR